MHRFLAVLLLAMAALAGCGQTGPLYPPPPAPAAAPAGADVPVAP